MTREEAIEVLAQNLPCETDEDLSEAMAMAIVALEQNVKLKEAIEKMDKWVHSGNRGNCDYFIVDQVEKIINGLKRDGMVSE